MLLGDIKPSPRKELEIWKQGWQFSFLVNQLNYFANKYKFDLEVFIENKPYCQSLQKAASKRLTLKCKKIDPKLLRSKLKNGPVVIYVDNFFFHKTVHAPHFFLVTSARQDAYTIVDSWDGKDKIVSSDTLDDAVSSLRNLMLYSPVIIYKK